MISAAQAGEVLRVVQAHLQGQLTLGGVDVVRVGQTNLHLQIILGFVPQPVVRVLAPGPALRVLYGVGRVLRLQVYEHRAAQHSAYQNKQRRLEISNIN